MVEAASSAALHNLKQAYPSADTKSPQNPVSRSNLDVRAYLGKYGYQVAREKRNGNSTLYILESGCLFDSSHTKGEAAIGQADDGKLFYHCFHDSCQGHTWHEAREIISGNDRIIKKKSVLATPTTDPSPMPVAVPSRAQLSISEAEWTEAKLTPRCITKDYIYADVGVLSAPGGTGKTTITLYESIHVALGHPLYGLEVVHPGWVLFVTAEDSREILIARLREVAIGMNLTRDERTTIKNSILFWDVSGEAVKLIEMVDGNIVLTETADAIVAAHRDDPPAVVYFDPIVSFGVGESRINDNEHGLITAGRRIRNGLQCAVRVIAHTGQTAAREKTLDQYTSRGGTALPDGSRMSFVLQPWTPKDHNLRPPQGCTADQGSSVTILARPKLSYAKPNLPLIWIKRTGWTFEYFTEVVVSEEEREWGRLNQLEQFLISEESLGRRYNKTSLEAVCNDLGFSRRRMRNTATKLLVSGRVIEKELPKDEQSTRRKTYLSARRDSAGFKKPAKTTCGQKSTKSPINNAAAYRKDIGGVISPPDPSPFLDPAAEARRDSAGLAGLPKNPNDEVVI